MFIPFQITEFDAERAELGADAIGQWAVIVSGTYQIRGTESEARKTCAVLNEFENIARAFREPMRAEPFALYHELESLKGQNHE